MRSVQYEPEFESELRAIEADFFRADEFIQGAEWTLSRDPQYGTRIGSSDVWFLPLARWKNLPAAVIYYTFSDTMVFMLSIQVTAAMVSNLSR